MKYSREQRAESRKQDNDNNTPAVTDAEDGGGTVFFWREYEEPYGFLCHCAEQYMMYCKALVLATPGAETSVSSASAKSTASAKKVSTSQPDSRRDIVGKAQSDPSRSPDMIMAEQKPGRQKELARSVRFTPSQLKEWEKVKFDVVMQGSYYKYSQNGEMRDRLLATGDRELVEASPQDNVWGIGLAAEFAEMHRADWGSNLLGKALMTVEGEAEGRDGCC
ncbi:hypothetical protein LTR36_009329 [Oleoguttula mirabilis]|uniref:NADAR domain-containing protein n=1 Tax=Oleoguttula mirabilis TaxID=1507867 RepID=A0AAV9JSG8_9PEZI|nr:hypothetical protein LTR36_009329 [Oleoguttula mirabilis]